MDNKQVGVRIFIPLNKEYYLPSPWVQKGKHRSYEPVEGQPQFKLAEAIEIAVQKGQAIVDSSMCITDCYSSMPTQKAMHVESGEAVEYDQIELQLSASGADGTARIGLAPAAINLGIFGNVANAQDVTVGGDYGVETLNVIGKLAQYGFLKFTKVHIEADAEGLFGTTPRLKTFSHTGQCMEDKRLHYPKATAEDDNTNIRTMTEEWLKSKNADLTFDGKNFLEVVIPDGRSADYTLYTAFYPKA